MPSDIKAIVFKTAKLKKTRDFFEKVLELKIKESSAQHFVIYSKSLRLVFVESKDFEVEIYLNDKSNQSSKKVQLDFNIAEFRSCKDPNGIRIIIT